MGHSIPRIPPTHEDPERRAADRARLLERVAIGLAHEGKNPLHNMVLHLQLMAEKLAQPEMKGGSPIEKHLAALRDGIGRVDHLLKAFGEFASPDHLPPDLGAAVSRALQLFAYDARRASVQLSSSGPALLMVRSESRYLSDLVAHALVACIDSVRDGGQIDVHLEPRGAVAVLDLRADGGLGNREEALPHLDAARSLAPEAACELSIESPPAGGARLSLSFLHTR
jgi:C4-dicarboxylate-specific signal transduction histidine kinase